MPSQSDYINSVALSSIVEDRSGALFVEMGVEKTGISLTNDYSDSRMWWELYREFALGAIGTGVSIGDFDGDGLPDLYLVSKTESNRLYRNLGDWRFEDVTERAGVAAPLGTWCQGSAFVDYDNDGDLDIYLCRFAAANILYRNNGDNTFVDVAAEAGVAVVDASGMASFADFDRDGYLDFYLQTNVLDFNVNPSGQEDYLFRNRGDGTFEDVTKSAGIQGHGQGHSATWFDYNSDGWPDVYVANDFAPADAFYHNNGDGTFSSRLSLVFPHTPNSSMGADVGDLDNDGLIDFMVGDMAARSHEKDMRGMVDGREEARDPHARPMAALQYPRNAVYLNSGMGRFMEAAYLLDLDATDWTWSLRFEDLDNDGRVDLHVTTGMIREFHGSDLMARMRKGRTPRDRVAAVKNSPELVEANLAFRNMGDYRFEEVGKAWGLDQMGISFGAAFGDMDLDGDLDLVFSNYQNEVTVLQNTSSEGNRIVFSLKGVQSNSNGIGTVVTLTSDSGVQTKTLLSARGYLSTSEPVVHFGLGADSVATSVTVRWPSGIVQRLENLEAGRKYRVVEPSESSVEIDPEEPPMFVENSVESNLDFLAPERLVNERKTQPLLPRRHNRLGPALAVGDLDGDEIEDLVFGGAGYERGQVLLGSLEKGFSKRFELPVRDDRVNDGPVLLLDFDQDGDSDILVTATGVAAKEGSLAYQPYLLVNDGSGAFGLADENAFPSFPVSVGAAVAADFDRDGDLDVFLGGRVRPGGFPGSPKSGLFLNEGGRFVLNDFLPEELGMVSSALWTDVDRDGWMDLLLALEWGQVRCFRNLEGNGFEDVSEKLGFSSGGNGWWNSIAAADFNGDGVIDYAVGNVGLNTDYEASLENPLSLYYGKYENSEDSILLEVKSQGGVELPVRGLSVLSGEIPGLKDRFVGNNEFSKARIEEVVTEVFLRNSNRYVASQLGSGVFLSKGDGKFDFQLLPRFAQLAPFQGIVAGDFDGDGNSDIYALQNSYSPIPSVGRFDGGLSVLLLGNGKGGFQPVSTKESGLLVPRDAKALVVVDHSKMNHPSFVLTRNNSESLAFIRDPSAQSKFVSIQLDGENGNQGCVGARVTVRFVDGSSQTQEVYGGSGYFSQSSTRLYFGKPVGSEIDQIDVSWPNGTVEMVEAPFTSDRLRLSAY